LKNLIIQDTLKRKIHYEAGMDHFTAFTPAYKDKGTSLLALADGDTPIE
jgi:hypothetical protein